MPSVFTLPAFLLREEGGGELIKNFNLQTGGGVLEGGLLERGSFYNTYNLVGVEVVVGVEVGGSCKECKFNILMRFFFQGLDPSHWDDK